jgi:heme/copper-type cytochrome/quinol oxidase subunit 3/cytochrome oxidase assembly protein ShyY1
MYAWWSDVITESRVGDHTPVVQIGLRYGFILFIISEVMFFSAWFWSFFKHAIYPMDPEGRSPIVDGVWPPAGIETFDPWHLPLINTLILLCSGCAATWAHHALVHENNREHMKWGLWLAVALGVLFTMFQIYEYSHAHFGFAGNIYGANFFMATGFHGFHVIIGTIFLGVCLPGSMPATSPRKSTSASRPPPGTGTSSTWSGCSSSRRSTSGAADTPYHRDAARRGPVPRLGFSRDASMRRLLLPLAFGLIGTAILIGLGIWQVQRLAWKTGIIASIESAPRRRSRGTCPGPRPRADRYRLVAVEGAFLPGEAHVYTSAPPRGVGYRVVAPFETADGRRILVDRGFVPIDEKDAARPLGPAAVEGALVWPDETDRFTSPPDRDQEHLVRPRRRTDVRGARHRAGDGRRRHRLRSGGADAAAGHRQHPQRPSRLRHHLVRPRRGLGGDDSLLAMAYQAPQRMTGRGHRPRPTLGSELFHAVRLDPRPRTAARLRGGDVRGARPRRRALPARDLAAARAGRDRRVRRPALRGGRLPRDAALPRRRLHRCRVPRHPRRAYAGFGHVARCPLVQIGPNDWLLELFHGPTLAFKDVAMQLIGQMFQASAQRAAAAA